MASSCQRCRRTTQGGVGGGLCRFGRRQCAAAQETSTGQRIGRQRQRISRRHSPLVKIARPKLFKMNSSGNSVAFGAPGIEPRWTSSAKEGLGTAYHTSCRLWFTLSHGIVNEIYYPHVDQ